MAQYIEKNALVAEIERLKRELLQRRGQCKRSGLEKIMHQIGAYNKILSLINILEVKEVDLDNELDFAKDAYYYFTSDERSSMKKFAKYFFELGLKVQKGE